MRFWIINDNPPMHFQEIVYFWYCLWSLQIFLKYFCEYFTWELHSQVPILFPSLADALLSGSFFHLTCRLILAPSFNLEMSCNPRLQRLPTEHAMQPYWRQPLRMSTRLLCCNQDILHCKRFKWRATWHQGDKPYLSSFFNPLLFQEGRV